MKRSHFSNPFKSLLIVCLLTAAVWFTPTATTATFTVNSTADTNDASPGDGTCADASGNCTLRAAIQEANQLAGSDTIEFNIGGGGLQTITLTSGLPTISQPVFINGPTQPGFSGTPLIEVNGNGVGGDGFTILSGSSTVRGLIINRFAGNGITIQNTGFAVVQVCYIGTNAAGTAAAANGQNGIMILGAPSNTIGGNGALARNVIAGNSQSGIVIQNSTSDGNFVQGNYIGTNAAGTAAIGNGGSGIRIDAPRNFIGGGTAGVRNIISGNALDGVLIFNSGSQSNEIKGNYIGVDVTGNIAIPNRNGIVLGDQIAPRSSSNDFIGTDSDGVNDATEGNVISGNLLNGVVLIAGGTTGNRVAGNEIGTNAAGNAAVPNGQHGVLIMNGPDSNVIGTNGDGISDALEVNLISGNSGNGVVLNNTGNNGNSVSGNRIGTDITGTAALGNLQNGVSIADGSNNLIGGINASQRNAIKFNTLAGIAITGANAIGNNIRANSIFANGALGIDLGNDGVTPNDPGDTDGSPNHLINFPVITLAQSTGVQGTLNSTPNTSFRIDIYTNTVADASGFGEGETLAGSVTVTTDGSGNASFNLAVALTVGQFVTATATSTADGTSEFSQAVPITPAVTTAVEFASASATAFKEGVLLEWRTGFEVDNIGFNIYREIDGQRTLVTPDLVAGAAFFAGEKTRLTAGKPYVWIDRSVSRRDAKKAVYWIEDLDLDGTATLHGPFHPAAAGEGSIDLSSTVEPSALLQALQTTPPGQAVERQVLTDLVSGEGAAFLHNQAPALVIKQPDVLTTQLLEVAGQAALKIAVARDGWYRVSPAPLLAAAGSINPAYLQLSSDGVELPCRLASDGAIEFFGQGLDLPTTDKRIYWLSTGLKPGLRLAQHNPGKTKQNAAQSFPCTLERRDRMLYFSSLLNGEAENIFGPVVRNSLPTTQSFTLKAVDNSQPASLEVRLQGVTNVAHRVRVQVGATVLGTLDFAGFVNHQAVFSVPAGLLVDGVNSVTLQSLNAATDLTLVDRVRLTYPRRYIADNNQLRFQVAAGEATQLSGFTDSQIKVYDVSNPQQVKELRVTPETFGAGDYGFGLPPSSSPRTLLAMAGAAAAGETLTGVMNEPSNWKTGSHGADLLIVTHRDFRAAVELLAAHRRSQGLAVEVVDVEDIYDEFAYGRHTPLALRQFFEWAASGWQRKPRYLLLVGDSTWDPRNYLGFGQMDFVPTRLIDTPAQETSSDDWLVDFNNDSLPEWAVGRLPVRTAAQAVTVVTKLLAYDNALPESGRKAVLVADRGFELMSGFLQTLIPAGVPVEGIRREGADALVRNQILAAINGGAKVVHYTGHGSVSVWTSAGLLTTADGAAMTNGNRLAVMVMQTCLNAYMHDASVVSLGEGMLLGANGGAVAVWASSGMTESGSQQQIVRRLYEQLGTGTTMLGQAMKDAKGATADVTVRRTWILLGDPTTRFRWNP